jgi:hypothetical protein
MLFLHGVYVDGAEGGVAFHGVGVPTCAEFTDLRVRSSLLHPGTLKRP